MNKNNNQPHQDDKVNQKTQQQPENVAVDENAAEIDETSCQESEDTEAQQEDSNEELIKELAATKEFLEKEKKEYLFLMAEFDNFRKRTIKEKADIIKNAAEKVLGGLLPIVDDFERGIEANKSTVDADTVKEGMELIYNKLVKFLEQNGVKPIESTGMSFDPDFQEAIAMVPAADEASKGKVIDTPTKGYTINDKVLRHAKVVVAQ